MHIWKACIVAIGCVDVRAQSQRQSSDLRVSGQVSSGAGLAQQIERSVDIRGLQVEELNRWLLEPIGNSLGCLVDGERMSECARTGANPDKREKDWSA
jgi:hypothetical protein